MSGKYKFIFLIIKEWIPVVTGMTLGLFITLSSSVAATKESKKEKNEIQRSAYGVYDLQRNTISNIDFYTTNYGIFGLNVATGEGGGYWPRGSFNQYIFGGGIWFAAKKPRPDDTVLRNYCLVTYNPNSGRSWMVPGRIEDGPKVLETERAKYRTYFSTDINPSTGEPRNKADGPNWPIWDTNPGDTLKYSRYFGKYIDDVNKRNTTEFTKGPAFISGEDIFATFKDTDLNRYEGGEIKAKNAGYPLGLQIEHTIYSWGFGDYRDFIFLRYDIINYSDDTLKSCWMAPVMDVDLARAPQTRRGAANDRVKYYDKDTTLNLAFQWTNPDLGEGGYSFGYLGFDFLESPAVIEERDTSGKIKLTDSTGFVRRDKRYYTNDEQLGLVTFRNWSIENDILDDDGRYLYLAAGVRDGDTGPGDKRFMMATGPFHMRPRDTVRVIVGIILANTTKGKDADGTDEDLADLIRKDKFAQQVYDNNFQAPSPPLAVPFEKYVGLQNAIKLYWTDIFEDDVDKYERGMDFLGYRLYRARRVELDTFTVDEMLPSVKYTSGTGPFGWKQVAQYEIPTPFKKSVYRAGMNEQDLSMPLIDSLRIVGPVVENGVVDEMALRVMKIGKGITLWPDSIIRANYQYITPVIWNIDTSSSTQPWGPYFKTFLSPSDYITNGYLQLGYEGPSGIAKPNHPLFNEALIGIVRINSSLQPYNPLYYSTKTINFNFSDTTRLKHKDINGIVRDTLWLAEKDTIVGLRDTVKKGDYYNRGKIDTIYFLSSIRKIQIDNTSNNVIDIALPRKYSVGTIVRDLMADVNLVKETENLLYSLIKRGWITSWEFPNFEESPKTINNVIRPYMKRLTNDFTFQDIGDDDKDGVITYNADPKKTEKLINNVDYYYKLLSYDEGDYLQPTPGKMNTASEGSPNLIKSMPKAAPVGKGLKFEVIDVDSSKIGGLYNFQLYAIDDDRTRQLFLDDTLELEFQPYWQYFTLNIQDSANPADFRPKDVGFYNRKIYLKNITTGKELFNGFTWLETSPCFPYFSDAFTENTFSTLFRDYIIRDSITNKLITYGTPFSREIRQRSGRFSTGDFSTPGFCYNDAFTSEAYGILGFNFDYSIQQWGGIYRPDSSTVNPIPDQIIPVFDTDGVFKFDSLVSYKINSNIILAGDAMTPVTFIDAPPQSQDKYQDTSKVFTTRIVGFQYSSFDFPGTGFGSIVFGSYNNGPAHILVEFLPGGDTTLNLKWGANKEFSNTFNVKYLKMKVKNVITYNRPKDDNFFDSVTVSYPVEMPHIWLDSAGYAFPRVTSLGLNSNEFIGKYNIAATGFVNGRGDNSVLRISRQNAIPATGPGSTKNYSYFGSQGVYYISPAISEDGKDTLDFVHILTASSCRFAFDFANKARAESSTPQWGGRGVSNLDIPSGYTVKPSLYKYDKDFEPGDKVLLKTLGGALGLPLPGAKVKFRISESTPSDPNFLAEDMDRITVVPNPYYISHQAQKSPYDAKIYFTRLPKRCTIDIYTITGDLVKRIEHDEYTSQEADKASVEVWDLLSSNEQRVQSQTLAAHIKTPDGAETIKQFTVVVGGFRIIQE